MKFKKIILASLAALLVFSPATAVLADTNLNQALPKLGSNNTYSAPLTTQQTQVPKAAGLPTKYDPRGSRFATPVGNQNYLDICWAYTATDLMALSLRKSQGIQRTFSPNYYNYLLATNAFTQGNKNLMAQPRKLNGGGDDTWAEVAAFQGYTPVSKNVMGTPVYPTSAGRNIKSFAKITKKHQSMNVAGIFDIWGITSGSTATMRNRANQIKQYVRDYGGASLAVEAEETFDSLFSTNTPVYTKTLPDKAYTSYVPVSALNKVPTSSSQGYKRATADHQVTIVGWDDNYDRHNFNQTPPANGAFLVKSSWGTSVLDKGYAWLSYYDLYVLQSDLHAVKTGKKQSYKQYTQVNGAPQAYDQFAKRKALYLANTYKAKKVKKNKVEKLKQFSFYTMQNNVKYTVYFARKGLKTGKITSMKGIKKVGSGTITRSGLQKIKLKKAQSLKSNSDFTVIVRVNSSNKASFLMPVQVLSKKGRTTYPIVKTGRSYISTQSKHFKWKNYTNSVGGNMYINAYTKTVKK
ncbi:hypothetical protein EQG49_06910 [Periweissella cryptocerci]|uniref:Lectin-like domain-containing protein n=1 Tax=Periweissella cryptocerci TaxID=2506420 RepID=A0A4P6YU23_9LACO|nr:lectin like domain-containing protein [Periweissella cryptocerci]QBO36206.1 hypothetical protein EQG49_06910 [Periweissella cryptocerci]